MHQRLSVLLILLFPKSRKTLNRLALHQLKGFFYGLMPNADPLVRTDALLKRQRAVMIQDHDGSMVLAEVLLLRSLSRYPLCLHGLSAAVGIGNRTGDGH